MTMLCRTLDYAECPFPRGECADECTVVANCPISLTECEQRCSDARCAAVEDDCS